MLNPATGLYERPRSTHSHGLGDASGRCGRRALPGMEELYLMSQHTESHGAQRVRLTTISVTRVKELTLPNVSGSHLIDPLEAQTEQKAE